MTTVIFEAPDLPDGYRFRVGSSHSGTYIRVALDEQNKFLGIRYWKELRGLLACDWDDIPSKIPQHIESVMCRLAADLRRELNNKAAFQAALKKFSGTYLPRNTLEVRYD